MNETPENAEGGRQTTWSYDRPAAGTASPLDFSNLIWSWIQTNEYYSKSTNCTTIDQLTLLICVAFQAGLKVEEGRTTRFRILFRPSEGQVTVRFNVPFDYTVSELVKIAPTIGLGFRYLLVDIIDGSLRIIGIMDPELSKPHGPISNYPIIFGLHSSAGTGHNIRLTGFSPGHLRATTSLFFSFDLSEGCIRFPLSVRRLKLIRDWGSRAAIGLRTSFDATHWSDEKVAEFFDAHRSNPDPNAIRWIGSYAAIFANSLISILRSVVDAKHGGTFLVVADDACIVNKQVNIKYSIHSPIWRNAISELGLLAPDLSMHTEGQVEHIAALESFHFIERKLARINDCVASMASVDGAVLLTYGLHILGFGGVIETGNSVEQQTSIEFVTHPDWTDVPLDQRKLTAFGTRHRSAIRFCREVANAIAFVISQDGSLRVFINRDGTVKGYEPVLEAEVFK